MTRTHHHRKGDCSSIKKNKSGCKSIPRKEWREGSLFLKAQRSKILKEEIKLYQIEG
jgi:hypothetical protein